MSNWIVTCNTLQQIKLVENEDEPTECPIDGCLDFKCVKEN